MEYRIFSIRRPRRLFQTWPDGPGVYLIPADYSSPVFITNGFYLLFLTKMYLANISTAFYSLNKYLSSLFATPPWRPGVYSVPGVYSRKYGISVTKIYFFEVRRVS